MSYAPSHNHHERTVCERCASVIAQCRCIAPKSDAILAGPCLSCSGLTDAEAAKLRKIYRNIDNKMSLYR